MTELEFMGDEDSWPGWPILPLKKKGSVHDEKGTGVLVAGHGPVIYLINMYAITGLASIKAAEQLKFDSLTAIVDNGWVVD
jgi:hypothetical protein